MQIEEGLKAKVHLAYFILFIQRVFQPCLQLVEANLNRWGNLKQQVLVVDMCLLNVGVEI